MVCRNCGSTMPDHATFCAKCGSKIQYQYEQSYNGVNTQPSVQVNNYNTTGQGEHVSTGGWFGRILLSCIPIVGLIMLFVWAFGSTPQKSLKTWARAQLIFILIPTVIFLLILIIGGGSLSLFSASRVYR